MNRIIVIYATKTGELQLRKAFTTLHLEGVHTWERECDYATKTLCVCVCVCVRVCVCVPNMEKHHTFVNKLPSLLGSGDKHPYAHTVIFHSTCHTGQALSVIVCV